MTERFTGNLVGDKGSRFVIRDAEFVPADVPPVDPPPVDPPPASPRPSGLAWDSGVWANDPGMPSRFGLMRGRPVDVADVHCESVDVGNPYWLRSYKPSTVGSLTLSCPLSPNTPPAAFEAAGEAMAARGFAGPLARLRPGVEFNLDNESRATNGTVDAWIARFRLAAQAFRKGAGPGSHVCLSPNEGNGAGLISAANTERIADVLTRDGSADEIGPDFYDQWPPSLDDATFRRRVFGGFGSLGWWADFAHARGARISVPEWGVARTDGGQWKGHAGGDNPVYIRGMVNFFRAEASVGRFGYESYFAEPDDYIRSDLTTQMPSSRAAYIAALK